MGVIERDRERRRQRLFSRCLAPKMEGKKEQALSRETWDGKKGANVGRTELVLQQRQDGTLKPAAPFVLQLIIRSFIC